MKKILIVGLLAFLIAMPASAHGTKHKKHSKSAAAPSNPRPTSHVAELLAQFKPVKIAAPSGLSPQERKLAALLVSANNDLEDIFWRQNDPEGLALYQQLQGKPDQQSKDLRHLLMINGSRFNLVTNNEPFVGKDPMPPGRGLYPAGLTPDEIEAYVAKHPDKKAALYSLTTIVRRNGDELEAVPYHIAYRSFLESAAKKLRQAADITTDPAFAKFLKLRADALLSDDYYASDVAWMDMQDPKFDIIFAPYEVYIDDVLGVKGSFGGAVLIRNETESAKLKLYQKYVPAIQQAFPLAPEDKPSKEGQPSPMEVMNTPFRAGDLRHGYQAVADNLPNDPRIHELKGTKKIFFKDFMDARVNEVILPIGKRLMRADQAAKASGEGYMASTVMHEIAHGLGPAYARVNGKKVDIREAIGPVYSSLEEAKADIAGLFGLDWLMQHDALPKSRAEEYYASYVAGIFRTIRFSTAEAHGRAEMMEFNYLSEQGAITRDAQGKYVIDFAKMPKGVASLAKELLEIEATGDRKRAESWMSRYDKMPAELQSALKQVQDVPVDVDPQFSYPEPIQ